MNDLNNTKSNNLLLSIIIVVTSMFAGMLITLQFKSSIPATTFPIDELKAQKDLIESYVTDQGILKTKITNLRKQIDNARSQSIELTKDNNLEKLNVLKESVGLESLRGEGIVIYMNDGNFVNRESIESVSQSLIHASDLRDVVNILRTAKAEAISINDQRIIASTPITSVGNTILVNNFHLMPPFTITAIGEIDVLIQGVNDSLLMLDVVKRSNEMKIQFSVSSTDGAIVPSYNGNLNTKYISNKSS